MKSSRFLALLVSILMIFAMASASFAGAKDVCPKCGKEVQTQNAKFYVVYKDGKKDSFGCPHCGLSEVNKGNVKSAKATDFLRGKKIDAEKAFYLKGSEFGTCCAPYWLSFSSKDEAEKFSKGFGGTVITYEEALKDPDVQP
jgi:DNA-directed RNA polymerase subunit RPC12/RpoP